MRRKLSDAEMQEKSRPGVISLCLLTLRLMENWRSVITRASGQPEDADCCLIVMAVVAVGAEKFTRSALEPDLHNLSATLPGGRLNRCHLSSIAAATGINRETVRRKVNRLVQNGILEVHDSDGIRVTPDFAARERVRSVVQAQVDALARSTSQLRDLGVLESK